MFLYKPLQTLNSFRQHSLMNNSVLLLLRNLSVPPNTVRDKNLNLLLCFSCLPRRRCWFGRCRFFPWRVAPGVSSPGSVAAARLPCGLQAGAHYRYLAPSRAVSGIVLNSLTARSPPRFGNCGLRSGSSPVRDCTDAEGLAPSPSVHS